MQVGITVSSYSSRNVLGSNLAADWVTSLWRLHILPVSVWDSSDHSSFTPQSEDMQVGSSGVSQLPTGLSVGANCCSSQCGKLSWVYPTSHTKSAGIDDR